MTVMSGVWPMIGASAAVVGASAGVIGTYYARLNTRKKTPKPIPAPVAIGGPGPYDVFVSFSPADDPAVARLVTALEVRGVRVATDKVATRPGIPLVHGLEEAVRGSAHGLLVFSGSSMANGWVKNEYWALMQRSIETGQLFIPVRTEEVALPELAATRYHCDLFDVTDERYEKRIDELVESVRRA